MADTAASAASAEGSNSKTSNEKPTVVILIGMAGTGKTTVMQVRPLLPLI